jgi:hypothetical protein
MSSLPAQMTIRAACACAFTLAACGGGSSTLIGPPPPISSVAVSFPGGPLFISSTTPFEAREILQDGTTRLAASAAWSSDRPQVASVSTQGVVNAVAAGEATITADSNGARGSLPIRVFPNFAGDWVGREAAVSCVDSGALTGFCSLVGIVGEVFSHSSSFTQNFGSVTAVVQTDDGKRATMNGSITIDGELQLNSAPALPPDPEFNLQVENWKSRSDTPSRMTGTYDAVVSVPGLTGSARVGVRLDNVAKMSTAAASSPRGTSGSTLRGRIRVRLRAPGR